MDFIHSVREENLAWWWWTCSSKGAEVFFFPLNTMQAQWLNHCWEKSLHVGASKEERNITVPIVHTVETLLTKKMSPGNQANILTKLVWAGCKQSLGCFFTCTLILHSVQTVVDENRAMTPNDCPHSEWAQGIVQQQNGVNEDAWCEPCSEQEVECLECLEERRQQQEAEKAYEQFRRYGDKFQIG